MKRPSELTYLLCLCLALGCLAGCGAAQTEPGPTTSGQTTSGQTSSGQNAPAQATQAPGAAPTSSAQEATILAAGDIATCGTPGAAATAKLVQSLGNYPILGLGDYAYESGTATEFAQCYDPFWGKFSSRLYPAAGNHEYYTDNARDYFKYFGSAAGDPAKGYYSFDLGAWHLIALNANCDQVGGCQPGSIQEQWLRADLAAHHNACTLAFWHQPRFSSGEHGSAVEVDAFWRDLYAAHATLVLNGHDHDYERFDPQDPTGKADANGIREIIVGTGGASHYQISTTLPNSVVNNTQAFGVLQLQLHPTAYDWKFIPEAGETFHDEGSASCATVPAPTPAPPSAYETAVLADKPTAYWRLEESNGTAANDQMKQNAGEIRRSINLGIPGALPSDKAMNFAGTDGYIFVGSQPALNIQNDISVEAWAKPVALDGATHVIVEKGEGSIADKAQYRIGLHSTNFWQGCLYVANTEHCLEAPDIPSTSAWTHLVLVRSGSNVTLWVNGKPAKTATLAGALNTTDLMLAIGRGGSESTRYFNGGIDEVAVYDHALTPERVSAHFAAAAK